MPARASVDVVGLKGPSDGFWGALVALLAAPKSVLGPSGRLLGPLVGAWGSLWPPWAAPGRRMGAFLGA